MSLAASEQDVTSLADVRDALRAVGAAAARPVPDVGRIDQLRLLEEIKSAAAAAQARVTAAFASSQRTEQQRHGVPADRAGRGVASQVALALRTSPFRARRYVGWATILTAELPHTLAQLDRGVITEWRAMLVARESATLSRAHRTVLDAELAPHLERCSDQQVEARAKQIAYRLDPQAFMDRTRGAESDRRVSLRPAPDTMARLTGFLPVAQGVAAYAALLKAVDSCIAAGDTRSRGQIMADTLVERVTGQRTATDVPIEVNVVLGIDTLLGGDDEPAQLDGFGPVPASLARSLIGDAATDPQTRLTLRRLFADPQSGQLVQVESRSRCFPAGLQRFVRLRDRTCRTPWCSAPVRHIDHVVGVEHGGRTSIDNAQGLCQACNLAKQALGWHADALPDGDILILTPTGHHYRSRAPDPPGPRPGTRSKVEAEFRWFRAA